MSNLRIQRGNNKYRDINHNQPDLISTEAKSKAPQIQTPVHHWKNDSVVSWFKKHCGQYGQMYTDLFIQHDITGSVLMRLTDPKLAMMGIANSQHRDTILYQILRLKLTNDMFQLEEMTQNGATKVQT
jgi:predicted phosphoadenosine phosphosulfate sulfurtransferase